MTAASPQETVPQLPQVPFDYDDRELQDMVNAAAPKPFAVVAEWECENGGRDACVLAWGFQYEDGKATVVDDERRAVMYLRSAERAVPCFERATGDRVRLVWPVAA
jgi:hypothetical protein